MGFGMYPKGRWRTERVQAQADEDACWTMGSAKGRSRQRRAGQDDRPAEMACCQQKWVCCTHDMKGTRYAWWAGMLPANLHLSAPIWTNQNSNKKKIPCLPWNKGAASVHGAARNSQPKQEVQPLCQLRKVFPLLLYLAVFIDRTKERPK